MAFQTQLSNPLLQQGIELVRLLRISGEMKLPAELHGSVEEQLRQLCAGWTERAQGHTESSSRFRDGEHAKGVFVYQPPAPEPREANSSESPHLHYSLALKAKVNQGAPWAELQAILKQWWLHEPSLALSAKILEMSYVWSGAESCLEVMGWFCDFTGWQHLHEAIREDMIVKYHQDPACAQLMQYLLEAVLEPWLIGSERLVGFIQAYTHRNTALMLKLHHRFGHELRTALRQVGTKLGLKPGEFKYAVALARLEQGYVHEALTMVRSILPSESAYQLASQLKRRILAHKSTIEATPMHTQIITEVLAQAAWEDKERALRGYFEAIRADPGGSAAMIPTLGELLAKPALVPIHHPRELTRYVQMCLEYFDLYEHLPNIIWVFHAHACVFHSPAVDGAIWNHFLQGTIPEFPQQPWQAIALFHRFIAWGPDEQAALWEAYELMSTGEVGDCVIDIDFATLKRAGLTHLATSPTHSPKQVRMMRAMCELCAPDELVETAQIEAYLSDVSRPTYETLKRLWQLAASRQASELVHKVLHVMVQNGFIRTSALKHYLSFAMQSQHTDLSWRTVTVLKSRHEVLPLLEQTWQVSGENRQVYPMVPLGMSDFAGVLTQRMSAHSWKVFCALLTMGYRLPELIAHASYRHESVKWQAPESTTIEARILDGMSGYAWLHKPARRVADQPPHPWGAMRIAEAQAWVVTEFSCCISYLLECLGLMCLRGDVLKLGALAGLTMQTDAQAYKHNPTQKSCVKWYRSLSQEQKIAWLEICRMIRDKASVELSQDILKLVIRLAVLMLPAHYAALQTIQRLRLPLEYLRDLEAFILSEAYSQFRHDHRLSHRVPMPSYRSLHSRLRSAATAGESVPPSQSPYQLAG